MIDISKTLPRNPTKLPKTRNLSSISKIVIHTTDCEWSIEKLAQYDIGPNHIDKTGCPSITYHDVIMLNGEIYHTLDYGVMSWHAGPHNPSSVAVALMYKCTNKEGKDTYAPPAIMLSSLYIWCAQLCIKLGLTPDTVVGHRELEGTGFTFQKGSKVLRKTCPGMRIDLDIMRTNIAMEMQKALKSTGYYKGEIDGQFGPKSQAALRAFKAIGTHV